MYILKNAIRSVFRSKGRNFLMGLIVFLIALSACISLSIREASDTAKEEAMEDLKITAQISFNRESMMKEKGEREERKAGLEEIQELSLEELETYAQCESVSDFYYTRSASFNGDSIEPVDMTGSTQEEQVQQEQQPQPGEPGGMEETPDMSKGRMGVQGEFTVIGYSSDAAMTDFINGTSSIVDGQMFTQATADMTVVINSELASYNDLSVGDTIQLSNPNAEDEVYELTICGIYEKEAAADSMMNMMSGFSTGADSANQIYVSNQTLQEILAQSEEASDSTTAIRSMIQGTYSFDSVAMFETFEDEARELGLADTYTISSGDVTTYEASLRPLENLSQYAGYFLIVILSIGAAILIVLHIFSIRERKYEIGVLAAIGMKKWKIAIQFLTEVLCVTFCALFIGMGVGTVSSVPITNQLLEQQIESMNSETLGQEERFGRSMEMPPQERNETRGVEYVSTISSGVNLVVMLEMIGIGLLLTILSGCTALIFILRYDPLWILSNRD